MKFIYISIVIVVAFIRSTIQQLVQLISDERIKQDIKDANSQWDDIKEIKVRNFKRKDDVLKYKKDDVFSKEYGKLKLDNKLTFDPHVSDICNKVSQKLHALSRIGHLMPPNRRKDIVNAFVLSQFGY